MKKILSATLFAATFATYGFAQDYGQYQDPYQQQQPVYQDYGQPQQQAQPDYQQPYQQPQPAYQEPYQPQPAYQDYAQPAQPEMGGAPFFGIGLDLFGIINDNYNIRGTFRLNESMELSAILGLYHYGESTVTMNNTDTDAEDDHTLFNIGVAFDYYLLQKFIPFSVGGEIIYGMDSDGSSNTATDYSNLNINILAGAHAQIVPNLFLTGNAGLGIRYYSADNPAAETSRLNVGLVTRVYLTWFIL